MVQPAAPAAIDEPAWRASMPVRAEVVGMTAVLAG